MNNLVLSALLACLVLCCDVPQARSQSESLTTESQPDFLVIDRPSQNGELDLEALAKRNRERLSKRRKAYSEAKTLAQAIELARVEMKQQGFEQFVPLLTLENVVSGTKRSLQHRREQYMEELRKKQLPAESLAQLKDEFNAGSVAAFEPIIHEGLMPSGSFFGYNVWRIENGEIRSFALRLSVKPKNESAEHPRLKGFPLLEHQATIFSVHFGE